MDNSDEEEDYPISKSAKRAATCAATLEEYFKQTELSTSDKSTGVNKALLLPDSALPVYHLRIEDYIVNDVVGDVCKIYANYSIDTNLNWLNYAFKNQWFMEVAPLLRTSKQLFK